ncbi:MULTISPECIES: P-II family nitrogen regulator [unclassified Agarivorans]|uniref:P-II family nitrogen regulator n=1 Tax=unclassified Agarivorans TaxID=2636026 RepID=UPI0010EEDBE9|nr:MULTISPECIES: P-II family nitrogen regulator [unclassified Agarivorans]MDO6765587.1 P-II family nitrogen regulator [Agarivorans sp. 1_MG-2023]GDY27883.1 nitrogen regulatory protein P-II [Agarivorans sp. Toyoura001]
MKFKLILAFVDDQKTALVLDSARAAGATGATVINNARGEGVHRKKTFFGLNLEAQRDVLLFVVESHLAKPILNTISAVAEFDQEEGQGIAVLLDVEEAVGVAHQIQALTHKVPIDEE